MHRSPIPPRTGAAGPLSASRAAALPSLGTATGLLALTLLTAACGPQHAQPGVQGPSTTPEPALSLGASSEERFGGRPRTMPGAGQAQAAAPSAGAAAGEGSYHFEMPAGWTEAGPRPMRDLNLAVPGGVECWLTRLGPGAGGLEANLDRWRGQVGLGPATPQEVAELETRSLFGAEAFWVDLSGPDGGTRLVGLMQFLPDRSMFLRMSGPSDAVAAALDGFQQVAETLHDGAGHSHGGDGAGSAPSAGEAAPPAGGAAPAGAGGLAWDVPAGWQPLQTDAFRLAYYQVDQGTQCWISTLSGTGGGVQANLTRWAGQFGKPAPDATSIAALPRVPVLGQEALWVDLLGEGAADGMIGVLCELPTNTVFIKMQGPSSEVRAHESELRAFCESLRLQ